MEKSRIVPLIFNGQPLQEAHYNLLAELTKPGIDLGQNMREYETCTPLFISFGDYCAFLNVDLKSEDFY